MLVDDPGSFTGKRVIAECETDEEAAFIITACNSHDQLIAALDRLIHVATLLGADQDEGGALDQASKALAAAGIK